MPKEKKKKNKNKKKKKEQKKSKAKVKKKQVKKAKEKLRTKTKIATQNTKAAKTKTTKEKTKLLLPKQKVMLIILDGFGFTKKKKNNAFEKAHAPFLKGIISQYPYVFVKAHGESVGLLPGLLGGSEVGHLTMGAGRVVWQEVARISRAIKTGAFFKNAALREAMKVVKEKNSNLHLIGLLSDAGVHSITEHLFALIDMAKKYGVRHDQVWVHAIMDGRDTPPMEGIKYMKKLMDYIKNYGNLATIMGRYYAMDRDKRWERTKKAYEAMLGFAPPVEDPLKYLTKEYEQGIGDEFIDPVCMLNYPGLKDDDVVIFYNFRNDRPRQLCLALISKRFSAFKREVFPKVKLVTMTHYDDKLEKLGAKVAFKPITVKNTLTEWLSKHKIPQLHAAESEKYAHVTFFFNGGIEKQFPYEDRIIVPSPKVPTYDLKPEMSAYELTTKVIAALDKKNYGFVLINFANPDMVGHTGKFDAAVKAIEAVDVCVHTLVQEAEEKGYKVIIGADHGNCEEMSGRFKTSHTKNLVRFIILDKNIKLDTKKSMAEPFGLCSVAPTILEMMHLKKPHEMKCKSFFH